MMINPMQYAANPLKDNSRPIRELIRELYLPTQEENIEWLAKKQDHDDKRKAAIAKLEREGYW